MVNLTDKAAEEFKNLLKKEGKPDYGVKVFVAGIGCSGPQYGLSLEKAPEEGEKVFESKGVKIYLSPKAAEELDEGVIDYIKSEYGEGFVLNNPNAKGCGPSCGGCG